LSLDKNLIDKPGESLIAITDLFGFMGNCIPARQIRKVYLAGAGRKIPPDLIDQIIVSIACNGPSIRLPLKSSQLSLVL
jgi:hypothetical protein